MATALNRFISQSADRCRPFFQLLHKWKDFTWSKECDKAFEDLKAYLAHPSIMSRLEKEWVLYAYIVVTLHAESLVLVRVEEGIQKPVYYVSKSLQEAEVWYLPLEKAILAIIHAMKKLPHYFQAHTIVILAQLPLQALLHRSNYTGRVTKWRTMLSTFDIRYLPRTVVKGQVLAYLVAEFIEEQEQASSEEVGTPEIGLRVNAISSQ